MAGCRHELYLVLDANGPIAKCSVCETTVGQFDIPTSKFLMDFWDEYEAELERAMYTHRGKMHRRARP